jgi:hypothetical protein
MKASDAFNPGDAIYPTTTDAQTVSSVDPTSSHIIGYYVGPAVASAASGQVGEFVIGTVFGASAGVGF